ncbi:Tab2 family RNA-binding protein [Synechocystis sp. LKSZ1]|uniref:Tab2 family RNA-binding protein n=1 Tax=Synechocystis sp. LKSZ1 TaxID=3144951 RepID=UPI00336BCB77
MPSMLPPPQPLPEHLWGEQWRFVTLPAGDFLTAFQDRPIPYASLSESLWPFAFGVASTQSLPGIVIYAGRQSRLLCQWLTDQQPQYLSYTETEAGQAGGLLLQGQLQDRWILVTFQDAEIAAGGQRFSQRQQQAQGLHFLWVQPDDSGMTTTGIWLLQKPIT